jgi:hypothetical protein
MSRKLLRTGLAACALAGLLATPVHAAGFGDRSMADGIWQWFLGMWQDIRWTIDPNGSTTGSQNDTRLTIDPNGDEPNASEREGDISMGIDPDGDQSTNEGEGDISMGVDPNG